MIVAAVIAYGLAAFTCGAGIGLLGRPRYWVWIRDKAMAWGLLVDGEREQFLEYAGRTHWDDELLRDEPERPIKG